MPPVDGGAPQLQYFAAQAFVGHKIEFLLAVVPQMASSRLSRLHPIGTHNFAGGTVFDYEMIAEKVEPIFVQSTLP